MEHFHTIIIGSGPSSFGYCLGLKSSSSKRVAVITSEKSFTQGNNLNHRKLTIGHESLVVNNRKNKNFPITSALGGLSNAWGGVLVSGDYEEYKDIFQGTICSRNILSNLQIN